jgi:hypothetical protein
MITFADATSPYSAKISQVFILHGEAQIRNINVHTNYLKKLKTSEKKARGKED